jgi:hypothetical protein
MRPGTLTVGVLPAQTDSKVLYQEQLIEGFQYQLVTCTVSVSGTADRGVPELTAHMYL